MRILRSFADVVDRLNTRLGSILRWLALLMVLMGAYNAVARYLTRYTGVSLSSNALNEAQWYLFSLIFLLGAAYGLKVDAHVRVDVLYGRLGEKARGWIDLVGTAVFLLPFAVLMLWVSFPTVRNSWSIREVSPDPGGLPRYPIKAVILISFALLLLQGLAQLVRAVDRIRGTAPGGGSQGAGSGGAEDPFVEPGTEHSAGGHL
jgi:TRAP-type mannitol/chloroaromatic compound transport system permease small subunit